MSAKDALEAWHDEAKKAAWRTPAEIKAKYRSASILKGNRVVFNIKGNDYRLVVKVNYDYGIVYVRFVGTHRQYDAIDAPHPIAAIRFRMEQGELTNQDLVPYIGHSGRVSEVLNYKRHLTLNMIRRLHHGLQIPTDSLIATYDLA